MYINTYGKILSYALQQMLTFKVLLVSNERYKTGFEKMILIHVTKCSTVTTCFVTRLKNLDPGNNIRG